MKEKFTEEILPCLTMRGAVPFLEVPIYSKSPEEISGGAKNHYEKLISQCEVQGYCISKDKKTEQWTRIRELPKYQFRYNFLKGFVIFYYDGGSYIKTLRYLKDGKIIKFFDRGLEIDCLGNNLSNEGIKKRITEIIESEDFLPYKNRKYFIDLTIVKHQMELLDFSKMFNKKGLEEEEKQ